MERKATEEEVERLYQMLKDLRGEEVTLSHVKHAGILGNTSHWQVFYTGMDGSLSSHLFLPYSSYMYLHLKDEKDEIEGFVKGEELGF